MFYLVGIHSRPNSRISNHARLHPHLHWHAAVGAVLHLRGADATRAVVATRRREVSLRVSHTHDARGLAAEAGFGNIVAASDVADIGERQHRLSRSRNRLRHIDSRHRHYLHARGHAATTAMSTTPTTTPATFAAPTTTRSADSRRKWGNREGYSWHGG